MYVVIKFQNLLRTLQLNLITLVSEYKYLGTIIDDTLHFSSHINYLKQKLKKQLGFYCRNKSCFSFNARKKLVSATFLPILDYGNVVYRHALSYLLASLCALRFITDCKSQNIIVQYSCLVFSCCSKENALLLNDIQSNFGFFTTLSLSSNPTKSSW